MDARRRVVWPGAGEQIVQCDHHVDPGRLQVRPLIQREQHQNTLAPCSLGLCSGPPVAPNLEPAWKKRRVPASRFEVRHWTATRVEQWLSPSGQKGVLLPVATSPTTGESLDFLLRIGFQCMLDCPDISTRVPDPVHHRQLKALHDQTAQDRCCPHVIQSEDKRQVGSTAGRAYCVQVPTLGYFEAPWMYRE